MTQDWFRFKSERSQEGLTMKRGLVNKYQGGEVPASHAAGRIQIAMRKSR
jgi:hypothetical protein